MSTYLVQKFRNWLSWSSFFHDDDIGLNSPATATALSFVCCHFVVLCCLTWKNFEFWIITYIHLNLPKSTAKLKTKKNYAWRRHLSPVYTGLNIVYRLRGHESSLIIIPEMLRQSRTFEGVSHWKALKSYISIVSRWRNRLKNSRFLQNDVTRGISQISKRRPQTKN